MIAPIGIGLMHTVIFLSLLLQPARAQITEKQLIDLLARENLTRARLKINDLARRYPNSPAMLFMQASFTENAQEALELYKKLTQKFPNTRYGIKATYRIGQFYFARGFYYMARKYFKEVVRSPYNSGLKEMAQYYAAKCLFAAGKRDSARAEWLRLKQISQSQLLIALIEDDLRYFESRDRPESVVDGLGVYPPSVATQPRFAVQIGAYRKRENAESQKKYFGLLGYPVEIQEIVHKKKTQYRVILGKFHDRETAKKFGEAFKKKFQLSYHIIKLDERNHD
ncbi:MAG: SPOR domain-containing protein [candidate division KSB1 bacterium]|nr:SPOR domain-containing protein [candidate division KSB1 bacterium]